MVVAAEADRIHWSWQCKKRFSENDIEATGLVYRHVGHVLCPDCSWITRNPETTDYFRIADHPGLIHIPFSKFPTDFSAAGALECVPPRLFRQIHHPRDLGPVRAGTESLGLPETYGREEMAFFDPHLQAVCGFIRLAC